MIAEIIEAPISSPEQYEQIRQHTGLDGDQAPPGAILHVAGPADDGRWRLITVWETGEAASRWGAKVRAARVELGFEGQPRITRFEVHNLEHTTSVAA